LAQPVKPPPPDFVQSVPKVASTPIQISPVAQHVHDAVAQMHTVGGAGSAATLNSLRQNITQAIPTIEQLYRAAPASNYTERWSLVKVLVDLHHPSTLTSLNTIVNTPLPNVQGEEAPFTLAEETMIRTTAAEEIGRQAGAGQAEALALLLKNCQNPVFSVKQTSVQAYLAHGGPNARATLEKLLPPGERFVLDIRAIGPAELAQPDAGAVKTHSPARETPVPSPQGTGTAPAPTGDAPAHKLK
jgi:hypothetical protein